LLSVRQQRVRSTGLSETIQTSAAAARLHGDGRDVVAGADAGKAARHDLPAVLVRAAKTRRLIGRGVSLPFTT
jgi:hypothetical protein